MSTASASAQFCDQCGAALVPGARFCRACGHAVTDGPLPMVGGSAPAAVARAPRPLAVTAPWWVASVGLLLASAYILNQPVVPSAPSGMGAPPMAAGEGGGGGDAPFANGGGGGGTPPDISNMTPRERASRLHDRVMRYVEEGKTDSAAIFAPMALSSFSMLGDALDAHARYDYGRIAQETGDLTLAAAQADTILRASPTHLLGLALAANTATKAGNAAAATQFWQRFRDARSAEMAKNLEEYQAHANDVTRATTQAGSGR
ncbi:MAG: zinc ribbon domain-containing protein [Gemmatimonadaceae bacterium]|nr:zinc ribbon domain-containing protein [Gemmatimonadaceae bacterium]